MAFACITPALVTGSMADRMKLSAFVVWVTMWTVLVYPLIAHRGFSPGGWFVTWGALDFAGGYVVHSNAGAAGLAMAILLGRREGWPERTMQAHNLPLCIVGLLMIWFGWFGFNAGSAITAKHLAAQALLNTNLAACTGLLGWIGVEAIFDGRTTAIGAGSGAVAGLVAITPAAGYVDGGGSLVIGAVAGGACAIAIELKWKTRCGLSIDDSLDVVGVHLFAAIIGCLLIGLLATTSVNPGGADGAFYGGGFLLLGKQAACSVATCVTSFSLTWLIGKLIDLTIGLRVPLEGERLGLDIHLHKVHAYSTYDGYTPLPDRTSTSTHLLPGTTGAVHQMGIEIAELKRMVEVQVRGQQ